MKSYVCTGKQQVYDYDASVDIGASSPRRSPGFLYLLDIEVSHQNLAAKKPTDHLNNSNILGVCVCVSLCHCVTLSHAVPLAHCRHVMQKKRNSRPTRGTSNSAAGLAYLSHAASLVSLCRSVCLKVWEQRNCY